METCTVKWIIIGTCLLITLTGLWLAVLREIRNIKTGKRDIQKILYDKENKTINLSLAIGVLLIGGGLFTAIYTEKNNIGCDTNAISQGVEKEEAKILFKLDYNPSLDNLRLLQRAPEFDERNIAKQESGYFEEEITLPTGDNNFFALVAPRLNTNTLGDDVVQTPLEICFQRTNKKIREDGILAIIYAGEDKTFRQEPGDPGCVTLCNENQASLPNSFHLFPRAFAQTTLNENKFYGWAVPNLQTLKDERKKGFSQIVLDSKFLNAQIKQANRYYYSVKINDIPIFFDGLLPKHLLSQFDYDKGLHLEFGIENLGFSGNDNGFEKIEINIEFYRNSEFIKSIPLKFDYVALRRNDAEELQTSDGSKFQWKALFTANQENQIFIGSMPTVEGAVFTKKRLNTKLLSLNDNGLIGVIRPPFQDNPSYGVCVGLLLPNKQIQFTFTFSEAAKIKEFLKNYNYRPLIRTLSDN